MLISQPKSGRFRVTIKDNNGSALVVQEDHYYPFCMLLGGQSYAYADPEKKNDYLYNGKEFQEELGLDWYDYGARFYDPQLGRWHSIDPSAESYRSWTPYNYCLNNPINLIDPDGMLPGDSLQGSTPINPIPIQEVVVIAPRPKLEPEPPLPNNSIAEKDNPGFLHWLANLGYTNYETDFDRWVLSSSYKDDWLIGSGKERGKYDYSNGKRIKEPDFFDRWVTRNCDQSEVNGFASYWGATWADATNRNTYVIPRAETTDDDIDKNSTGPGGKTNSQGRSWENRTVMKANGILPDTMFIVFPDSTQVYIKTKNTSGSYYLNYNKKTK
jgi:RHS repeat-associated protein